MGQHAMPLSRRRAPQRRVEHYRRTGLEARVSEANPQQLINLLLEGACQRIALAQACLERGEIARKGKAIGSACAIIAHLNECLDHAAGGEIATRLSDLYDWLLRHLTEANANNDASALQDALEILGGIQSAWAAIGAEPGLRQSVV